MFDRNLLACNFFWVLCTRANEILFLVLHLEEAERSLTLVSLCFENSCLRACQMRFFHVWRKEIKHQMQEREEREKQKQERQRPLIKTNAETQERKRARERDKNPLINGWPLFANQDQISPQIEFLLHKITPHSFVAMTHFIPGQIRHQPFLLLRRGGALPLLGQDQGRPRLLGRALHLRRASRLEQVDDSLGVRRVMARSSASRATNFPLWVSPSITTLWVLTRPWTTG